MRMTYLILALVVAIGVVIPAGLTAQTTFQEAVEPIRPNPEADKAIGALKSPYCPGLMLEVCSSARGALLRDSIQMLARDEGWSSEELIAWVLERHGDTLLATPRVSGVGLVAWSAPFVALILGVGVVMMILRAISRREPVPLATTGAPLDEADEALLKDALADLDSSEEPIF